VTSIGVDVSQSGGQWYVNAVRTWGDSSNELTSKLKGNDVIELIGLFRSFGAH
jgi:hypothetical protein